MLLRSRFHLTIVVFVCLTIASSAMGKAWLRKESTPQERAKALLDAMTTEEKLNMLHGSSGSPYVGYVAPIDRLGIPALTLNDGPQGFRDDAHPGTSTCWPSTLTIAATWDRDIVLKWGKAMGKEFYGKGSNVFLGPGLNVARVPVNGRNFEYLSGADPYLGYSLVQPLVKGVQSEHVIANAKHWIQNNQENDRGEVSANVDEITRHEIYYQPFYGAVEAGVGSFMCSYNKINNVWSCENDVTLKTDLKNHLNFTGWVMSDWGATHSVSINQGLDQEMPGMDYFGSTLTDMVNNGTVSMDAVNDSVTRILVPMFSVGVFDFPNNNDISSDVTSDEHNQLAREFSSASHVLLKNNNNILPLSTSKPLKMAVFGKSALEPVIAGGGSGAVFPAYVVSPLKGILEVVGLKVPESTFSCNATLIENAQYYQWGCESAPGSSAEDCCNQCGKMSGCHHFTYLNGRCGFYPTGAEIRPSKDGKVAGECKKSTPSSAWQCNSNNFCVAFHDGVDIESAKALAKEAEISIVAISQFSREGSDRDDLSFDVKEGQQCQVVPPNQNNLVASIASTGTKTIVAATAPGAVLMPWKEQVEAIFLGFMPGQEYGHALADVLFGKVNPSAKLPMTIPNIENEVGFTRMQYPGIKLETVYTERTLIDYRWYNANGVTPAFPFGFGLSYTSFDLATLTVSELKSISVVVQNTGAMAGSEVVQLYVQFPEVARAAPLQLKGFQKSKLLQPGESEKINFTLRKRDLSIWDPENDEWKMVPGTYNLRVGTSSANLPLSAELNVRGY